jgi:hypothetical protein
MRILRATTYGLHFSPDSDLDCIAGATKAGYLKFYTNWDVHFEFSSEDLLSRSLYS